MNKPEFRVGHTLLPRDMNVGDVVRPNFGMQGPFIDCLVMSKDNEFVYFGRPYMYKYELGAESLCSYEHYSIEITSTAHIFTLLRKSNGVEKKEPELPPGDYLLDKENVVVEGPFKGTKVYGVSDPLVRLKWQRKNKQREAVGRKVVKENQHGPTSTS